MDKSDNVLGSSLAAEKKFLQLKTSSVHEALEVVGLLEKKVLRFFIVCTELHQDVQMQACTCSLESPMECSLQRTY